MMDRNQNKQILALQRRVASMASSLKPKRSNKSKKSVSRPMAHPLLPQVKAMINPFDSTPGVAKHLVDPYPSQSYKLKARATLTIGNQQALVFNIAPMFGADSTSTLPSAWGAVFAPSLTGSALTILRDGTQVGTAPVKTAASAPTYVELVQNKPYQYNGVNMQFRLVSYGIRMRYTGTALNANGSLKMLPNDQGSVGIQTGTTWQNVLNAVDSNAHTILRSVYDKAVYEFHALGDTEWLTNGRDCTGATHDEGSPVFPSQALLDPSMTTYHCPVLIGQNDSPKAVGHPGMIITYQNNSTTPVQFEVEVIENWECKGPTNVPFHTDSHANPELSSEVFRTVISGHMHAASSSVPNVTKSLREINKVSKSPLGKAVIAAALA